MPLPEYKPHVEERPIGTPYSDVQYRPNAAALGQGIEQVAQGAEHAQASVEQAQADADALRAANDELKLTAVIKDQSYGPNGFLKKQGLDALDPSKHLAAIDTARAKISDDLANDRQRYVFNHRAAVYVEQVKTQFDQHSHGQTLVAGKETAAAFEKNAIDYAGVNFRDEAGLIAQVNLASGPLENHLRQIGADPNKPEGRAMIEAGKRELERKVYGTAVKGFIDSGDGAGAQAFFDRHKSQLGAEAPMLSKAVGEAADGQRAESIASSVVAQARDPGTGWIDPGAAIKSVEGLDNAQAKIKEHARRIVEDAITKDAMVRKYQGEQILQKGLGLYLNGAGLDSPQMAEIKAKMTDPKNVGWGAEWNKLVNEDARKRSEGRRDAAESRLEAAERRRQEREGDLDARGRFNSLSLEDRASLNVDTEFLGKTTPRELDNIRRLQKKAKDDLAKGNQSSDADLQKTVRSIYNDLGLNGQTKGAEKKRREVQGYMDSFVEKYRTDHAGKYPTRDELSVEAVKATQTATIPGFIFDTKKPVYEVRPGDKVRVSDPNGKTFKVDAAGLDEWIAAHKGWKRL